MRRWLRVMTVSTTIALLALTACARGDTAEPAGSSPSAPGPAAAAFPVTVTHKLGRTVVPAEPKRVVTLGMTEGDITLALGVVPVGMYKSFSAPSGLEPWTQQALKGATPTLISADDSVPLEQVAALAPDLILAGTATGVDASYAKLSAIAPTIAYTRAFLRDPWQDQTRTIGQALGRSVAAEEVVTATEARLAAVVADNTVLAGKTFTISNFAPGIIRAANTPDGTLSQFFTGLGLTLAPSVTALPGSDGVAEVSLEKMNLVDADVMIAWFYPTEVKASYEKNPLYGKIPAVAAGRSFALDTTTVTALAGADPLTIPYAIDTVLPDLVKSLG